MIKKAKPIWSEEDGFAELPLNDDINSTKWGRLVFEKDIITERKSIADELEIIYYVLHLYHQYLPTDTASSVDALNQLAKELRENGK